MLGGRAAPKLKKKKNPLSVWLEFLDLKNAETSAAKKKKIKRKNINGKGKEGRRKVNAPTGS